jgi:hypothetical protein
MDREFSLLWLSACYIYPATEGFAVGIQDCVIKTRSYERLCLGVEVIETYR